jgi:hypothetical protein
MPYAKAPVNGIKKRRSSMMLYFNLKSKELGIDLI